MITGDDDEDQSDDDDDSLDGEDSKSIDSDGETSIDGDDNDERPTPTSDAARNQTNPTLALPELDGISDIPRVSSGDRPNAGAIAGGVIGKALNQIDSFISFLVFFFKYQMLTLNSSYRCSTRHSPTCGSIHFPDTDPTENHLVQR